MEKEHIIKEYDPVILKKLGAFTIPHLKWIIIGVLALMVATGADLIKPIVIQKTIDNNVLPHYSRILLDSESIPEEERIFLDESYFYHSKDYNGAPAEWHLVETDDDLILDLVDLKEDLFITDGKYIAISDDDFKTLTAEERKTFRKDDISSIVRNSLILIFLLFLGIIFTFVQIFLMALTSQNIMKSIRVKLFGHITKQSLSYLSETPVGKLVSGITNDVATIDELFTSVFSALLRDVLLMGGVVIALFYLDVLGEK